MVSYRKEVINVNSEDRVHMAQGTDILVQLCTIESYWMVELKMQLLQHHSQDNCHPTYNLYTVQCNQRLEKMFETISVKNNMEIKSF